MPADPTLDERLISLAQLLQRFPKAHTSLASKDVVTTRLESIDDDRLGMLAARLQQRADVGTLDAEDALLLRLLVDEYTAAGAHLREVVQRLDESLTEAFEAIKAGRRAVMLTRAHDGAARERPGS